MDDPKTGGHSSAATRTARTSKNISRTITLGFFLLSRQSEPGKRRRLLDLKHFTHALFSQVIRFFLLPRISANSWKPKLKGNFQQKIMMGWFLFCSRRMTVPRSPSPPPPLPLPLSPHFCPTPRMVNCLGYRLLDGPPPNVPLSPFYEITCALISLSHTNPHAHQHTPCFSPNFHSNPLSLSHSLSSSRYP